MNIEKSLALGKQTLRALNPQIRDLYNHLKSLELRKLETQPMTSEVSTPWMAEHDRRFIGEIASWINESASTLKELETQPEAKLIHFTANTRSGSYAFPRSNFTDHTKIITVDIYTANILHLMDSQSNPQLL